MKTTIQSLHFKARPELDAFIHEKVGKLARLEDKIETADVYLKLEKSDAKGNKVCEIRLKVPENELFAKKQCHSFEEAAVETINALQEQLRKIKD
ncbi:MAG: HPF/RaiA family ribosome-associated protein [Bacteroidota bacterium]